MSWFKRAVDRGVEQGVAQAFAEVFAPGGKFDAVVERTVWEHLEKSLSRSAKLTRLGFIWALRLCFRKHGSSYAEASALANTTLADFLEDEKIKFGDRAYAWTREGAEALAEEYELRHWESCAPSERASGQTPGGNETKAMNHE